MIQDSVNRISYDGNGIATEFAYPFSITTTNDVKVMIVDADGTETILTNDYYVDEANSKVDYPGYPPGEEPLPELQPPKLATGQRIVLYRELDVTQLTSLFDQYPFKTIEVMIDKTTILLQQLKDAQQRALTLSVSTGTDVSLILPAPSPHKSFRWNADGTKLELTADPATVLASVQGYTELAEGYADTADKKSVIATTGANTATEQASLAQGYAESINAETFNAATADKLKTARTIAGASFDGSANIDVSYDNLTDKPTIPSAPNAYVTSHYSSGTTWYRIWSNGWVEQGYYINVPRDSNATITLAISMADTDYDVTIGKHDLSSGGTRINITKRTTTVNIAHASWDANYHVRVEGRKA